MVETPTFDCVLPSSHVHALYGQIRRGLCASGRVQILHYLVLAVVIHITPETMLALERFLLYLEE